MISLVWSGDCPETQPWGCTPLAVEPFWAAKGCNWHCGVDIGMPVGTRLHAARAGQVTIVAYGELVISVSPTEADCYIHIDRAVVNVGTWVTQGQLVAYSGAKIPSGGSLTGPHLHFEVQSGALNNPATSLDPIPVLQGDDMTPREHDLLVAIAGALMPIAEGGGQAIAKALAAIQTDVDTIKASGGGGGLTAAQDATLTEIATTQKKGLVPTP
jgi:hypothetical protein